MKLYYTVFGAILVLFLYFDGGQAALKCYQCNSYYDKGCADFFDNSTYPLKPCPDNTTMCRKIIQETFYDGIWDIRYIRQCALFGEVGPEEGRWCEERTGTYRTKVKFCHCANKDGCNSATSIHLNIATISVMLLPFLAYLFQHRNKLL